MSTLKVILFFLATRMNNNEDTLFPTFAIGSRIVWENYKPLVIAEIWINHGWSLSEAKKIVDVALANWAEVIKHQTHIIEDEMTAEAKKVIPWNASKSIHEIMSECALSEDNEYELMKYVEAKGWIFISTPFSRKAADRLESFWVKAYKIWSWECNNYPLIRHISSFWKPIILSTWMNSVDSVRKSVEIMREAWVSFGLLHCTNVYPTPYNIVRLWWVTELKSEFPDAVVWLSDHTVTNHACLWAVALWASILERHFTDTMDREWPDIVCSMDWTALSELIDWANIMAQCRWWKKWPTKEEEPCIKFAFATIVTIQDIKKWESFTKDNIRVKRPWTWEIPAEHFEEVIWKKATKDLGEWIHITYSDIE